jgi:type II secretory pathway component GspD/PulD (secretin)
MESLTATLDSGSFADVTRTITRNTDPSSAPQGSWTKTFKLSASLSIAKYALGIANARTTNVEIMSRPMVVTIMGKPAVFESGDSYAGAAGGSTGAAVTSFNVGTAIEVTPKEMSADGRVVVDITITQSAFTRKPDRTRGIDDQMVGTIKSKLTSTVKIGFGQTIAIGGLYQKINITDKSGFPLLQDIPLVQYFFSKQETRDQMNSSLYLITMRRGGSKADTPSLFNKNDLSPREKLKSKGLMSIGQYPTLYYIFKYMANSPMFADFRSGDLIPPFWGYDTSSLDEKIHQLSSFLFF